jgi:C-terminal processing protease CtpA/Prc
LKFSTFLRFAVFLLLPAPLFGQPAAPTNLDFEQGQPGEVPPGWHVTASSKDAGYAAETVTEKPESGRQAARISAPGELKNPQTFGNLMTSFDATAYRGKRVRLRAAVRVEGSGQDQAALWLRVDRSGGAMGFFDNMANRPITRPEWKRYEIVGDVAPDAQAINFGMMMYGRGKAWIDSVSFEAIGEAGAGNEPARPLDARGLDNLAAFTRLLGYVRFFHPSDEAAAADWDNLALAGVQKAEKPRTPGELARVLEDFFRPVAPTLRVFPTAGPRPAVPAELKSPAGARPAVVSWRHQGVKLGEQSNIYQSARIDSGGLPRAGEVEQVFSATPYQGQRVVVRVAARAADGGSGVLKLRTYGKTDVPALLAESPAFTAGEWRVYELAAEVPKDVLGLEVDLGLRGEGRVWFDEVTLEKSGNPGDAEPLGNAGFEAAGTSGPANWDLPWDSREAGYAASLSEDRPRSGARSLLLSYRKPDPASFPRPEEPLVADLGGGVSAMVPLALYKDARGTLPRAAGSGASVADKPEGFQPTGDDRATRLADVVLAWTVFQHFYPYFDVVPTDWDAELRRALAAAATDRDSLAFLGTLRRLVVALHDGHGNVSYGGETRGHYLPVLWGWVEGRLAITELAPPAIDAGLVRGDVVVAIDGRAAADAVAGWEETVSGATPQWRRYRALGNGLRGAQGSEVRLEVRHPDGTPATVALRRTRPQALKETRPEPIAELRPGLFYVDLERTDDDGFKEALDRLAAARGVVFDLRGYPKVSPLVLSHLIDRRITSARWEVPFLTRPDRQGITYEVSNWAVEPVAPRLEGKAVFLIDGRAISYAETFLGMVENYRLAPLLGGPTAGTNGNVNPFLLPGGYNVTWTGMKVLKQDGSRHHGVGIQPTIPAARTLQGVAAGRDEMLEKGLELVGS